MIRRGATLVELLIVLAIIGVGASVVGLSLSRWKKLPAPNARLTAVAAARTLAVDSGRPVTRIVFVDSVAQLVTALPDGSVISDGDVIDRFSGKPVRREK